MTSETPYIFANGDRVWVIDTTEASRLLPNLLHLFRSGKSEPMIFGDAGQPEGVVIPWAVWQRLDALAFEEDGFEHLYETARQRLADPQPSIPIEEVAAELGWDLDEKIDDSDLGKPL
jgi:hypothetical protein